jgi:uncharacterized protein
MFSSCLRGCVGLTIRMDRSRIRNLAGDFTNTRSGKRSGRSDGVIAGVDSSVGRLEALDVLRGSAALGILLMNVRLFAEPAALYFNPTALGEPTRLDFVLWASTFLVADLKFLTIFALLFGAGILLMSDRIAAVGGEPGPVHYRRMGWLLLFGLIHAYLLWEGDILVLYAVCGAVAFPARRLNTPLLFTVAAVVFALGSALTFVLGATLASAPPEVLEEWNEGFWRPSPSRVANEIAAFQAGWLTQLPWRAQRAWEFQMFDMWLMDVWRVTGLMLAGMGLCRLGVLSGSRSRRFYLRLALIGFATGLPLVWWGLQRSRASGWSLHDAYFVASQWNYWGSVPVAFGWMGLILFVWRSGAVRSMLTRLAAVGRMAFTSYIAQTILCTAIFYGTGAGLFGRIGRAGQLAIVMLIWGLLLVSAPLWLARFHVGPLEWLWRRLTYGPARSG